MTMHLTVALYLDLQLQLSTLALTATLPAPKPGPLVNNHLPASSNLALLRNAQILSSLIHSSLTFSQANKIISPSNELPSDPFFMNTVAGGTVRFYNYGSALPADNGFAAIVEAQQECMTHLQPPRDPNARIGTQIKFYSAGHVTLWLRPYMTMTWTTWSAALITILMFVDGYEFVKLNFGVQDHNLVQLGTGRLGSFYEDAQREI